MAGCPTDALALTSPTQPDKCQGACRIGFMPPTHDIAHTSDLYEYVQLGGLRTNI